MFANAMMDKSNVIPKVIYFAQIRSSDLYQLLM